MKKLLSILLTSVLAIGALTGCGSKTEAPADAAAETDTAQADGEKVYRTLDEIKESGTVKIGVLRNKNPFSLLMEGEGFPLLELLYVKRSSDESLKIKTKLFIIVRIN